MNDLIAGAWRNGLDVTTAAFVDDVETRSKAGFRLLPLDSTVRDLAGLLDSYDELANELLTGSNVKEAVKAV